MARMGSFDKIISTIVAITLLLALQTNAAEPDILHPFDFFKLHFFWPSALCKISESVCVKPFVLKLIIGALVPMYEDDSVVPPFNKTGCTETVPADATSLTVAALGSKGLNDMSRYWRDVFRNKDMETNLNSWRSLWTQYGMCFKNPDTPTYYFQVGITVARRLDLLEILQQGRIFPHATQGYSPREIFFAIRSGGIATDVQIHCYEHSPIVYFGGISLCYDRNVVLINCPNEFLNCPDNVSDLKLIFPRSHTS